MQNSCCVIVGAGPGLGLNLARRFGQGGFDLALISRDRGKLEALSGQLVAEGYAARGFYGDAGSETKLGSAFAAIKEWNDRIGCLIYNAAAMVSDDVLEMTPKAVVESMAVNLGGAVCSVNQVLGGMRRQGGGTILLTGGGLGLEPYPDWASLGMGKAGLRNYGLALHKALLPENIHVAVVAVCGIVKAGGPFDPERIAGEYWQLHAEARPRWRRELVYLPHGADPYYNDPSRIYESSSLPIKGDG
ncbi:MAG: SDR family NAD(P)-dependent oxidoreductase [Desulfobacterales bacterium]|nr:SDR family NAD(P)-dependent oxidoreductase [Desulfobacterales bacterium]